MNNQNGQNIKPVSQEQKEKKGLFGKKTEDHKNKINTNNVGVNNNVTNNMNNNMNMQNNNQASSNFSNMNNANFNNVPQNNKPYISQNKKPYISNNGNSKNNVNTNSFNNMSSSMSNTNINNNVNNNGKVQNNLNKAPNNFNAPGSMSNTNINNNMNNNGMMQNNLNKAPNNFNVPGSMPNKVDPVSSLTSLENSNAIFPVLDKKGNTANNISSSLNNDLLRSLDSVSPISNNNISINNSSYNVPLANNNIPINNQESFDNQKDSGVKFDASNFNEDPISLDNRLEIEEEKKLQDEILGDISSDMDDSVETLSYDFVKAGAIPRILSFITDYIIIIIAAFVFFISFSTILTFVDSQVLVVLQYIIFTLILSLGFIFYRGMNEKYGTTIGRKVTKTMIVTKDGNQVNLLIALLRNLVSSILNGIVIGGVVNIVMMFIDKEKRSVEDMIFKTMTVRTDM